MAIDFEPMTQVRILRNVPLDNTYRNTIDFAGAGETNEERLAAQTAYFIGQTKYSFSDFTYQRMARRIRVPVNCELLYDCNYLMYLNQNFGNKWFYAFITDLEYANPSMTWVTFEIDVYQTWLCDMRWKPSFIQREHVQDDTPGKHIVPEDLDTGEYQYTLFDVGPEYLNNFSIVVGTTSTPDENVQGTTYNGIYSGCRYYAFPMNDDLFAIQKFLHELDTAGKGDAISSITMFPTTCLTVNVDTQEIEGSGSPWHSDYNISIDASRVGNYLPKNKKLFTYPYTFLKTTGNGGNDALFELEYFKNAYDSKNNQFHIKFELQAAIVSNPTIICVPYDYKFYQPGSATGQRNFDALITQVNYPQCTWSYGTFENWYAANSAMKQLNVTNIRRNATIDTAQGAAATAIQAGGAIGSLLNLNFGGAFNSALGAVNTAADTYQGYKNAQDNIKSVMLDIYAHEIQPPQTRGSASMGSNVAFGIQNFFFYVMQITENYAKRIDDYFTFYGYKVNDFKVPNLHTRAHWNYIQTIDCNIEGSFPEPHMEKLKQIFNKGITIWHFPQEVNAYEIPNEIITYTTPDYGRSE